MSKLSDTAKLILAIYSDSNVRRNQGFKLMDLILHETLLSTHHQQHTGRGVVLFSFFPNEEGIPLYQLRLSVISIGLAPIFLLAGCLTAFNVLIMSPFWAPYLVCVSVFGNIIFGR